MRRILIETRSPWLHRGYTVIGAVQGVKDSMTRLRYECACIDDSAKAYDRRKEILKRDPNFYSINISEVR